MSRKLRIELCPLAKKHHQQSARQFAHTLHKPGVICVTPEFYDLPQTYQIGILLHEIGHSAYGSSEQHTEADADFMAYVMSGVKVHRKTYGDLKNMEYINPRDKAEALGFLRQYLK